MRNHVAERFGSDDGPNLGAELSLASKNRIPPFLVEETMNPARRLLLL